VPLNGLPPLIEILVCCMVCKIGSRTGFSVLPALQYTWTTMESQEKDR
jgi:hypothetical protein